MECKRIGGGWVLIQDGDRLIVRAGSAGHVIGVALLLLLGMALMVGGVIGLWVLARGRRQDASGDAMALLIGGLLGGFFIATGIKLFADGEVACTLDRQSGTMQGLGPFRRKVVCRLDEIITNVEQFEWRTAFTRGPAYQVRLHPEVVVGGFSTAKAAGALASAVQEWLRKR
jgi:hypothetical protein